MDIEPTNPEAPTSAEIQDAEPLDNEDFLSMVRANNAQRQAEVSEDTPEGTPAEGAEDPEPPKEATPPADDKGEANVEVNPLEAKPKKAKKTKAENLKGMREALKAEREQVSTLRTELEAAQTKLEEIGNLEEFQVAIDEKNQRIKELEHLDGLMGLQTSKEYQDKYVKGADKLIENALSIAKDYDVPASVIKAAMETGNRREMNQLLGQHFDTIAIGDLRPIILETQKLLIEKKSADDSPVEARKELLEAAKIKEKAEKTKSRKQMAHVVQHGWEEMQELYTDVSTGVEILKEKAGNVEHNDERMAILKKASSNYADSMGLLVEHGLKDIPSELAKAFAARFQLAEVAGHLIGENETLRERLEDLEAKVKSSTSYSRPLSSGSNRTSGGKRSTTVDDIPTEGIAAHVMNVAQEKLANQK